MSQSDYLKHKKMATQLKIDNTGEIKNLLTERGKSIAAYKPAFCHSAPNIKEKISSP